LAIPLLAGSPQVMQDALGRLHPMKLRLFKNGDTTQIRVRKQDPALPVFQPASFFGIDRSHCWPDHSVAHAHNVDPRDALPDILVHCFQVSQNRFLPVIPISLQKKLPEQLWRSKFVQEDSSEHGIRAAGSFFRAFQQSPGVRFP
jgi:hypothetical protein